MIALFSYLRPAQSVFVGQTRVLYQWLRLEQMNQWWHWMLLVLVVLLIVAHVILWYRRDWIDLPRPVGWTLLLLRLLAFAGIFLFFFQLDKRVEQRIVRESRVAMLIDGSLSMTATGTPSPSGVPSSLSRSEEVAEMLTQTPILKQLSDKHQVTVQRFGQTVRPTVIGALSKQTKSEDVDQGNTEPMDAAESVSEVGVKINRLQQQTWAGSVIATIGLLLIVVSLVASLMGARTWQVGIWMLCGGSGLLLIAMCWLAWCVVPNTHVPIASFWMSSASASNSQSVSQNAVKQLSVNSLPALPTDWLSALQPNGVETRLGDAVRSVLDREAGNPLAGIVVVTDGRSNAGQDPKSTIAAAQAARVPLYVIGVGSEKRPANLQVLELDAPRRLYPGDRFSVAALLGSVGFAGQTVQVQFLSGKKDDAVETLQIETETTVEIPADGSLVSATVELSPKAVGSWSYMARVAALPGESELKDNAARIDVEVIERQNRVLIVAGGPLREYQFAKNMLYRDKDVQSHVWLQSGEAGSAQEAQKLLDSFPADRAALSQYDAVVAFDADWTKVPEAAVQALEKWVAEQAGGLILVAGSVETPKWLARSADGVRSRLLRDLVPVVLDMRGSALLASGRVEGENAWPLVITPDGRQAEFLWLTDQAGSSMELWEAFPGVHTFAPAYQLKPGAKALAHFSDPTSVVSGQPPIYLASQFYGAGRVVFQAGGEFWRLRTLGDQYFDRYYTKLVRWVSQGRLLLDSDRGVLLVDREEAVQGEQVSVRAVLKNERYEPLVQSEVVARLIDPQGLNLPLVLRPLTDGSQPGVFTGQFPVLAAGTYRLQLQLGGLASNDFLRAEVLARIPKVEMQTVERNDALLGQLASETGGRYWQGVQSASAVGEDGSLSLAAEIKPQDQVAYSPGAPEYEFQLRWLGWLMTLIATCLSLEWVVRRVHRLA